MIDEHVFKTIADLSKKYKVSLRTLRFYEERKLLAPYRIGASRQYSSYDETRLQIIIKAKRMGFSLAEIERLLKENERALRSHPTMEKLQVKRGVLEQKVEMLYQKKLQIEAAIEELKSSLVD